MTAQNTSVQGGRNIVVQIVGDQNRVSAGAPPHLTLIPWQRRIRPIKLDIDILDPACEAVPLIGRRADQDFLQTWLEGTGIAATVVMGRGGSGKTRLALDLLQNIPEGWDAGWLEHQEARRFVAQQNLSAWGWERPTLVVIDYASLLVDTLKQWFTELADHEAARKPGGPALRILLLERHASDDSGWYRELADSTSAGRRIQELLRPKTPRPISPIEGADDRRAVLTAGMLLAAALAGRRCEALPPAGTDPGFDRNLAQPNWRDPLLLLMAAVSGSDGGVQRALALSRRELAIHVAARERDRFCQGLSDASRRSVLLHLYACAVLCGGLDYEIAVVVAELELRALHKSYPGDAGQAIDDLCARLGASETLPAMAPDLLAEAFLLVVFGERSGLGQQVIERLAPVAAGKVSANIIRLVQDFGHVEPAQQQDKRLLAWAELSLSWVRALVHAGESDIRVLTSIAEALPRDTLTLRGIAVEVTSMLVAHLRQSEDLNEEAGLARLARWLDDLSIRQSDMGQRESALASIEEAVGYLLELAERNREAFLSDLAMSLNTLSNARGDLGQRESALASITEAVGYFRELEKRNRKAFLQDLARSLSNLSGRQSHMGQRESALTSIEEAAGHHRELVEFNRESFLPDLANSLNNLSNRQSDMGQRESALASIEEAVGYYRELVDRNREVFLPDLAMSLSNLSNRQSGMGQHESALASVEEAVRHYRELTKRNQEAFLDHLAHSLSILGDRLAEVGRPPDARDAAAESLVAFTSFFLRYPRRYEGLARATVNDYLVRSQELGLEPDDAILEPYRSLLQPGGTEEDHGG